MWQKKRSSQISPSCIPRRHSANHITHWHFQVHVIHILKTVWQVPISMECLRIKSDFNHLTALLKKWLQMLLFYVWLRTTRTIESLKNIWEHPFSWPIRDKPSEIKLIFTWILPFNRASDSALAQGCIFLGEVHIKAHTFFCMYVPGKAWEPANPKSLPVILRN